MKMWFISQWVSWYKCSYIGGGDVVQEGMNQLLQTLILCEENAKESMCQSLQMLVICDGDVVQGSMC